MSKSSASVSEKQFPANPQVLIKYDPEAAPLVLAKSATAALTKVRSVSAITTPKQLESVSTIISDAITTSEEVEGFLNGLRAAIERACDRVREIPGYEDFEGSFTCRKWGLRKLLNDGISHVKSMRAKYLSDEQEKVRLAQIEADKKQVRINEENAKRAAIAAKAVGADKGTVGTIYRGIMSTAAPIVESKAASVAESVGAGLRYNYTAKITSLKSFLGFCLNNPSMLATLTVAIPEIEKAFRNMARDQKEQFIYPGIEFVKTPVDVRR